MDDAPISGRTSKQDWRLSEGALCRLLAWLDNGADSQGEAYLEMRRRLAGYFDRKNCPSADDLADETLNRVARRLEEEGGIAGTSPARYCYIVAKFVFLEKLRQAQRHPVSLDGLSELDRDRALSASATAGTEREQTDTLRFNCLRRCLQGLDPDQREFIVEYYRGEQRAKIENRQRLAARLDVSPNALNIRACRIRGRLETCVGQCLQGPIANV